MIQPTDAPPESPGRPVGRFGRVIAALPVAYTDGAVLAFALWTVIYHASFLFRLPPSFTFAIWILACAAAGAVALLRLVNAKRAGAAESGPPAPAGRAPSARWLAVAVGAGLLAALAAGVRVSWLPWWIAAVLAVLAAAALAVVVLGRPGVAAGRPAASASPLQSAFAVGMALLTAAGSLFLLRESKDDVFYVGKSVWVAERDEVPLRDFLFTEGVAPALSSQPPIASIEVFAGALGRTFGLHAASATWLVLLPILVVGSVLALWRLVHRWAPRRAVLAFTVAVGYLLLVVGDDAALGTFHLPRLHEGKAVFVSAAVPLMWVYLTDWFESRSRRSLVLVVALSVAAIGLTSTAAIILPLVAAAAGLGMAAVGRWREALVGFAAAVAYPVAAVLVTRLLGGPVSEATGETQFFDAEWTYRRTLLAGVLGVIGGVALWCGPFLVRRGVPTLLAAGAAVTTTVLLVPGVLEVARDLSGLASVLWRVPWLVPLPALIGLLCTVEVPRVRRFAGVGLAATLVAVFAIFGTPAWSAGSFVEVQTHPTWKVSQFRLDRAAWMRDLDRPSGLLLAPETLMRTMPMVTSRVRVVMARDGYLVDYGFESQFSQDRLKLAAFADGLEPAPTLTEVRAALKRLGVSVVCIYSDNSVARSAAPELDLELFAVREPPQGMRCFRTGGEAPAPAR